MKSKSAIANAGKPISGQESKPTMLVRVASFGASFLAGLAIGAAFAAIDLALWWLVCRNSTAIDLDVAASVILMPLTMVGISYIVLASVDESKKRLHADVLAFGIGLVFNILYVTWQGCQALNGVGNF